jgi:two-component system, cell cycle response regulator
MPRGWLASTFDMPAIVAAALGHNRGLQVALYHHNPGYATNLIAEAGSAGRRPAFTRTTNIDLDGQWRVVVRGIPVGAEVGAGLQALLVLAGGTLVTILLVILGVVLARSRERALRLVDQRTSQLRHQAQHDALTGLPNRRALVHDLDAALNQAAAGHETILALFDLDGFKEYNDTFGHPAGDALLARLGDRLSSTLAGIGRAYRMGGDEFCVLVAIGEHGAAAIAARAASALSETGEAFAIGCSYGIAALPGDADSAADALRIADDRMYEHKGSRVSAGRQSTAVLITAATERSPELGLHLSEVATLATMTAQRLEISEPEVKRITLAAELHDIGTVAIPDSILNRPGPLDEEEWSFMRRHTIIGERIIAAAPSLAPAAPLVRSSHERHDGTGYPDGLAGDQIPIGAAILAVCEAFDAMTSQRPYSDAVPVAVALAELRRCAGTQFHPGVVEALCAVIERPEPDHSPAPAGGQAGPLRRATPTSG